MVNPNLLKFLHMANVFGQNPEPARPFLQPQLPTPAPIAPTDVSLPVANIPEDLPDPRMGTFTPQNQMGEQFIQGLNSAPLRESYRPSTMRKIAGVVAGLGAASPEQAYRTSSGIMEAPYAEAQGDWKEKQDLLTKAAAMEDAANRYGEQNVINKYGKDVILHGQNVTARKNEQANAIAQAKQKLATFIANKPHVELVKGDKYWMAHDTTTNKLESTGMPTGAMTEEEAIKLKGSIAGANALAVARQQGANAIATKQTAPGENTKYVVKQDETGQFVLIPTTPGGTVSGTGTMGKPTGVNPQVPTQQRAALANAITKAQIKYPKAFVTATGGRITTALKSPGLFGGNKEDIDNARKMIEDEFARISAPSSTAAPIKGKTKTGVGFEVLQ